MVRDPKESSKRYLYSFSTKYFTYLLQTHGVNLDQEDLKFEAAISIRQLYMQVLETTMALFAAIIQASDAVPMWMQKYTNTDLLLVIGWINSGDIVPGRDAPVNLEHMATWMTENFVAQDETFDVTEMKQNIKVNLPRALKYLMVDFLNKDLTSEYNSIKHGLRISSGASALSLTVQETGETLSLTADFSSNFPLVEVVAGGLKLFQLSRVMLGFHPAHTLYRIRTAINTLEFLRFQLHLALRDQVEMQLHYPVAEEIAGGWETASETGLLTRMTNNF